MKTFQLTLNGYDGGTDATDHLVKWVKAPSREALDGWLVEHGLMNRLQEQPEQMDAHADDFDFEDGVDVVIEADGSFNAASGIVDLWKEQAQPVT